MSQTLILTHRGLQPSSPSFFSESSYEAFAAQLAEGFGIEFDFNLTQDQKIIIWHDSSLSRLTGSKDTRQLNQVSALELQQLVFKNGRVCFFEDLAPLLIQCSVPFHAFHLKGNFQNEKYLQILFLELKKWPSLLKKLFIFDLTPFAAKYLKEKLPELQLAASVSHPYDIERYNTAVKNTLLTMEEAIHYKELYEWLWLDEWDLNDKNGQKKLYTTENFALLRQYNFKIALVTPELHATSPGLLAAEAHPDAQNQERLLRRIQEILHLDPDAICTDYPIEVRKLLTNL